MHATTTHGAVAGARRARASAEGGFTLVETLFAATLVVIVLFAVFSSLDAASHSTAVNRSRTVAATLAEQELERLRSLSAIELANYAGTPATKTVGKAKYTIESRAEWVNDASGTPTSCDSNGQAADYIRITSTVKSNLLGTRVKPVSMSSIVAPRVGSFGANQGTLAVQVKNELDNPVPNMPVTISGPLTATASTNSLGCAVFGHIAAGPYDVIVDQPGWVDVGGNQRLVQPATVTPGTKQTVPVRYAIHATVNVNFDTKVGSSTNAATSWSLTAANTGLPTGRRVFRSATPAGTIAATKLFPFPDGYSFYSGGCTGADPEAYVEDYFTSNSGFVKVAAGGSATISVREPALNVQVRRGTTLASSTPFTQGHVVIRTETAGCDPLTPVVINGNLTATATLPAQHAHFPFGTYRICVDDRNSGVLSTNRRFVEQTGIVLNDPNGLPFNGDGTPTLKLFIDTDLGTNRAVCSTT
jgi:type II secretory pathway pseudopilin PulG